MKVKIRAFANLADLVGRGAVELELPEGATVEDALRALFDRFGKALEFMLTDGRGRLADFVKVFLNGRDIDFLSGLKTPLKDGDELYIFPPVGGG